jgi:hypothetical protein
MHVLLISAFVAIELQIIKRLYNVIAPYIFKLESQLHYNRKGPQVSSWIGKSLLPLGMFSLPFLPPTPERVRKSTEVQTCIPLYDLLGWD